MDFIGKIRLTDEPCTGQNLPDFQAFLSPAAYGNYANLEALHFKMAGGGRPSVSAVERRQRGQGVLGKRA
jgi:hypothetical protein